MIGNEIVRQAWYGRVRADEDLYGVGRQAGYIQESCGMAQHDRAGVAGPSKARLGRRGKAWQGNNLTWRDPL